VINHAHLGGQIRQHLGNGSAWGVDICYSAEPPGGLETGGGIVQALALLGTQPFVTVNADIYTDFDFKQLDSDGVSYVHLVLVNKNPDLGHHGDFSLRNETQLTNSPRDYTFAGIACYHPKVFEGYQQGRYSVLPLIRSYAEAGKARAQLFHGCWFDIGSEARLNAANSKCSR
jgi:MurNAc alpha-1-phosphate uridylyltransferase